MVDIVLVVWLTMNALPPIIHHSCTWIWGGGRGRGGGFYHHSCRSCLAGYDNSLSISYIELQRGHACVSYLRKAHKICWGLSRNKVSDIHKGKLKTLLRSTIKYRN